MDRRLSRHGHQQMRSTFLVPGQPSASKSSVSMAKQQQSYLPSFVLENKDIYAPLRFTMGSTGWMNDCVRPVLISPPTYENDEEVQGLGICPLIPAMEDLTSNYTSKTLGPVLGQSFSHYKKRSTSTSPEHTSGRHKSPIVLSAQGNPVEPNGLKSVKEAATALLKMRFSPMVNPSKNDSIDHDDGLPNLVKVISRPAKPSVDVVQSAPPQFISFNHTSISSVESDSTGDADRKHLGFCRLGVPGDSQELNSLHCFVRSELLELFVSDEHSEHGVRRVGVRCVYCARASTADSSNMASFYPKSLQDIYRSVCTWQRVHFHACEHIPKETRETYWRLKTQDKSRGKTRYWVTSAMQLALEDLGTNREGICFKSTEKPKRNIKKRRFRV